MVRILNAFYMSCWWDIRLNHISSSQLQPMIAIKIFSQFSNKARKDTRGTTIVSFENTYYCKF